MPINIQTYRTPNRLDLEKEVPVPHSNQNTKYSEQRKNTKSYNGKRAVTYESRAIKIIPCFSRETLKAKRTWTDVLQILTPQILAQTSLPNKTFSHQKENKKFQDKDKFKRYLSRNTALQKVIEEKPNPRSLTMLMKTLAINKLTPAKTKDLTKKEDYGSIS